MEKQCLGQVQLMMSSLDSAMSVTSISITVERTQLLRWTQTMPAACASPGPDSLRSAT